MWIIVWFTERTHRLEFIHKLCRTAVVPHSIDRFQWYDEGRRKWGWWSNSTDAGSSITLEVNTMASDNSTAATTPNSPVMVAFGCLHSGTKPMGIAEVSCVSGCACSTIKINARWTPQVSLTNITPLHTSQHPHCQIRFKVRVQEFAGSAYSTVGVFILAGTSVESPRKWFISILKKRTITGVKYTKTILFDFETCLEAFKSISSQARPSTEIFLKKANQYFWCFFPVELDRNGDNNRGWLLTARTPQIETLCRFLLLYDQKY